MKLNIKKYYLKKYPKGVQAFVWLVFLTIAIGGLFYPILGMAVLFFMIVLMITSYYNGRYWCGNLCPRGNFTDNVVKRFSRNMKMPDLFWKNWFRNGFFIFFMGMFFIRMYIAFSSTGNVFLKMGYMFVNLCLITAGIALVLGVIYAPRSWCAFCPMGTMQNYIHKLNPKNKNEKNNN